MRYENACEFYTKADWEGGLPELVLGYGVAPEDVPPPVAEAAAALESAYLRLRVVVDLWHGEACVGEPCPR